MQEFSQNGVSALLTCRILDEGIDIPSIDAALLVASTQSQRQRIQRIGRTLRMRNNKKPIIITLYLPETNDVGVISDDMSLFGNAATIYHETDKTCIDRIRKLILPD